MSSRESRTHVLKFLARTLNLYVFTINFDSLPEEHVNNLLMVVFAVSKNSDCCHCIMISAYCPVKVLYYNNSIALQTFMTGCKYLATMARLFKASLA